MGFERDQEDEAKSSSSSSTLYFSDTETQLFNGEECQSKDADTYGILQNTVPFDDAVYPEDSLDTQEVNLDGETQLVDFGSGTHIVHLSGESQMENFSGETQVVNLGGETQVLDLEGVDHINTLLFDNHSTKITFNSEGEGSDRTAVFVDTAELSDDDSSKKIDSNFGDRANSLHFRRKNGDHKYRTQFNALISAERSSELHVSTATSLGKDVSKPKSGSVCRGFTSVRAASMKASGLAARRVAHKKISSGSSSVTSESQSLTQRKVEFDRKSDKKSICKSGEEIDQVHAPEKHEVNKVRMGSTAVRKLFTEDVVTADMNRPDESIKNANGGADLPKLFVSEFDLVGLSYVDSQEPGESSQANALDFVDRFLKTNVLEFDQEIECGKSRGEKSKPLSVVKGTQSLAQTANLKSNVGERGVYDWDDNCEDEGGGDFFSKKKEAFFDDGRKRQRGSTRSQKPKGLGNKGSETSRSMEVVKKADNHGEVKDKFEPDSGLVLHSSKIIDKPMKSIQVENKKNLVKEFDEVINTGCMEQMVVVSAEKDVEDMLNIGADTQLAAEAMEALSFGAGVVDNDYDKAIQGAKDMPEDLSGGDTRGRVHSRRSFLQKNSGFPDSGVTRKESKQMNRKGTKLVRQVSVSPVKRNQVGADPIKAKENRSKSKAKEQVVTKMTEFISTILPETMEQTKGNGFLRKSGSDVSRAVAASTSNDKLVKKRHLQDEPFICTPIAYRTRQRRGVNEVQTAGNARKGLGVNDLTDTGALKENGKRTRSGIGYSKILNADDKILKLGSNQAGDFEIGKFTLHQQSDPKLNGIMTDTNLDFSSYPRGRRTRRKVSSVGSELVRKPVAAGNAIREDDILTHVSNKSGENIELNSLSPVKNAVANARLESSPRKTSKCTTPVNCKTPVSETSPICVGDEYLKQSCRKTNARVSLVWEINSLISTRLEPIPEIKYSRKRKDMADVRVLFSHHLDSNIIKQQKKILTRLGASVASSMSDATHFITDSFVRTRNMLEAIAFGKPVVTHLWLESCGQAGCLIDERNYILRDAKKEKEFGFNLPVSLARACQCPLLQGQRVLITPNTKPGKEILASLVKAVQGMPAERIGRSALRDNRIPDDFLVLSCEEDYAICVPFLEKGAAVYSSELLLNGIVTQKLEYERHRLFMDQVKKTRSTVWLKTDSNKYLPVATKCR